MTSRIGTAQEELRAWGFTVLHEDELGCAGLHHDILERVFTENVLIPQGDVEGPVKDRYRAKDACRYEWHTSGPELWMVPPKLKKVGERSVPTFSFFDVPRTSELITQLLTCIPPSQRREKGTFGVHAFRSFTNVVDGPHQDGFEWGMTYVLDRVGDGAVSYLLNLDGTTRFERQLQPGEIILFKDAQFQHGATRLAGNHPHRDALVMQFDAPEDWQAIYGRAPDER